MDDDKYLHDATDYSFLEFGADTQVRKEKQKNEKQKTKQKKKKKGN